MIVGVIVERTGRVILGYAVDILARLPVRQYPTVIRIHYIVTIFGRCCIRIDSGRDMQTVYMQIRRVGLDVICRITKRSKGRILWQLVQQPNPQGIPAAHH